MLSQNRLFSSKPTRQVETLKLDWKTESRVGSLDNAHHTPGGGNVKVILRRLRSGVCSATTACCDVMVFLIKVVVGFCCSRASYFLQFATHRVCTCSSYNGDRSLEFVSVLW